MTSKQRKIVAAIVLPVAVGGSAALLAYIAAETGRNPVVWGFSGIAIGGSLVGIGDALMSAEG